MQRPEQTVLYEVRARLPVPRNARAGSSGTSASRTPPSGTCTRSACTVTLPEMPYNLVSRLMLTRDQRIDEFNAKLEDADGVFGREFRAECRHCGDDQPSYVRQHWYQFVHDMAVQFARHPAVDGAAAHEHVQSAIRNLACDCCRRCRQAMFPWARLREELLALADPPVSPVAPPLILL